MSPVMNRSHGRQHGAVLFVALVFLLLVTLLALTAIGTSVLQEKMTGGVRNRQLSLMGAESALRGGEAMLWNASFVGSQPFPPCYDGEDQGTCVRRPGVSGALETAVQRFRTSSTWVGRLSGAPEYDAEFTGLDGDVETASLAAQPLILIEDLGPNVPPGAGRQSGVIDPEAKTAAVFYRITARSQGGSAAAISVVESVFSSANLTNAGHDLGSASP